MRSSEKVAKVRFFSQDCERECWIVEVQRVDVTKRDGSTVCRSARDAHIEDSCKSDTTMGRFG